MALRSALVEKGGELTKALLDHQLDQVTDLDLMIGLPQQRGGQWTSALRNLGSSEVSVKVAATTDRGEQLLVDMTVPAKGFADAVFNTTSKVVRVEIDPDKLYAQLDYSNDVAPRVRNVTDAITEASRLLSTQDNARAEQVARELLSVAPQLQEARTILGRALFAQNKLDEAERTARQLLDDPLPTPMAIAWANIILGQIALKKAQTAEAVRRFSDAVRADADYATSLMARAERIRAETGLNSLPIDDSAKAFVAQLDSAILSGKKAELESRIISGELVRFISGIVGTQPESWQTRVLRTEQLDATTLLADVAIQAKELGQERSGTAVLVLSKASGAWKLAAIELFEVR
jgi:tetratricopeptide (TPR) repeat protein